MGESIISELGTDGEAPILVLATLPNGGSKASMNDCVSIYLGGS